MRIGRDALCTVDDFIQPSFFARGGGRGDKVHWLFVLCVTLFNLIGSSC